MAGFIEGLIHKGQAEVGRRHYELVKEILEKREWIVSIKFPVCSRDQIPFGDKTRSFCFHTALW
jgi:hypothetical protein